MDLFISWSGERSKALAEVLSPWVRQVLQAVNPWFSHDIDRGGRWSVELARRLSHSRAGVVILTRENLGSVWLHFEAGALSKTADARLLPLLVDVKPEEVPSPLAQFQHTRIGEEEFWEFILALKQIAVDAGERTVSETDLRHLFDQSWPQLAASIDSIVKAPRLVAPGALSAEAEEVLAALRSTLLATWSINSEILRREVLFQCNFFTQMAAPWRRGEYRAPRERYNTVLLDLYKTAKREIFSTSVAQYLSTWNQELGRRILAVHAGGSALVTRVFRFDRREEIDEVARRIMRSHADTKNVSVRVFIDSEDPFDFPPQLSRDFTFIDDGEVIGVTTSYGTDELEAHWHFHDRTMAATLRDIRDSLISSSATLDEFDAQS